MSTTTIRLEEDLKDRVAAAAGRAGKTAHAFMLEAITQTVQADEVEAAFDSLADQRWATLLASGKTLPWDQTKAYLEARARGHSAKKPSARKQVV